MKSILAHYGGNRKYISIIKHLKKQIPHLNVESLHNKIYDICYIKKPKILLFPVVEYTQEIHTFFSEKHKEIDIILYVDIEIQQKDLKKYLTDICYRIIVDSNRVTEDNSSYVYAKNLYDEDIFRSLDIAQRNNKVAVSLSQDMSKNDKYLNDLLYPKEKELEVVLFNNPNYKNVQNVGIFNENDLNYILNTFGYFLDLDDEFIMESSVVGCSILDKDKPIKESITNNDFVKISSDKYSIGSFVTNVIMPLMEKKL